MKDRLVITVSDVNNSKSYNVNKIIKKVILWTILVTLTVVSLSFFTISRLATSVNSLSKERDMLTKENTLYSNQIEAKVTQIKELGDELQKIEDIIGINVDDTTDLIQRATLAKLSSAEKSYMLQTIPNSCPLEECITTSKFGWRTNPVTNEKQYHKGIDLRAARRTPIYATADGVVRYVEDKNQGTFGRVIIISHNFGFETVYGHLRFADVKVGDVVKKGQTIGRSGNSGRSNGPHLHYEVIHASKVLDPRHFIDWNLKNYEDIFEKQRRVNWESLVKLVSDQSNRMVQR
jgi:murein DD-endopeptidase MepM/ murein hydrolase activator NlpD